MKVPEILIKLYDAQGKALDKAFLVSVRLDKVPDDFTEHSERTRKSLMRDNKAW